ncbi:MAG: glucokinase [Hyphomonadaceae bacterium]|nr:glucokinase [Hyphomonadaceae bacterium]
MSRSAIAPIRTGLALELHPRRFLPTVPRSGQEPRGDNTVQHIIVGELEGNHARLARASRRPGGAIEITHEMRFERGDLAAFEERFERFRSEACPEEKDAALAVGGPVEDGAARLTKESFTLSARRMKRSFGLERVVLLNDCVALARGVPECAPETFVELVGGHGDPGAAIAIMRPATGLGMAWMRQRDGTWFVQESEGGHQAYAPSDLEEAEIWRLGLPLQNYVTFEDIVCEAGIVETYRHLSRMAGQTPTLSRFADVAAEARTAPGGPAARACMIAARSMATFAGNACLAFGARGGAVIAGRVAVQLEPYLLHPSFQQRFHRRGLMTLYLADTPVRLLKDEQASLRGAAAHFFATV